MVLNAHCLLGQFFVAFTLIFQKPNPLNLLNFSIGNMGKRTKTKKIPSNESFYPITTVQHRA